MNPTSTGWSNPFFIVLSLIALGAVIGFAIGVSVAERRARADGSRPGGPAGPERPPAGDHRDEVSATSETRVDETLRDVEHRSVALLRSRRHAFLNHLQVISGWLQLGNAERAAKYIDRVLSDMEEEGRFIRAADPALVAFLLAKAEQAKSKGVDLTASVEPRLAAAEQAAAGVQPALDAVIDRVIATSPRSGAQVRLELSAGEGTFQLLVEVSEEADAWLADALATPGARRESPGRWVVTWPEGRR